MAEAILAGIGVTTSIISGSAGALYALGFSSIGPVAGSIAAGI